MEAAGQEQIPILAIVDEWLQKEDKSSEKKMHPASIKLVQHFRQKA